MVRIIHHRIRCIGCNYCIEAAPYRWVMDDADGKSILVDAVEKRGIYTLVTSDDEYTDNLEAAELCPVKVIRIEKF